MSILFLGLIINPDEEELQLNTSKIGLSGSANTFQWSLIDGFAQTLEKEKFWILNTLPVGTFPNKYKKLILKSKKWRYNNINSFEVGCINLPVLKQITRRNLLTKKIREWVSEADDNKTIIAYSLYPVFIDSLKKIKKDYPEVKITVIVPDLPSSFGVLPKSVIKALIYRISGERTLKNLYYIDSFVLLTKKMKERLKIGTRPFIVIEGIVSNNIIVDTEKQYSFNNVHREGNIILYTGSLNYQFGIKVLLQAFQTIEKNNYELWICGSGEAEREIRELLKKDNRIKFFGYVTKQQIFKLQQESTILINPRVNQGEYTKYSFPSKTMEYMASGKPVLMYKLDGVPDEYNEYLYYINGNGVEPLKKSIIEVCSKSDSELADFGLKARKFVFKYKNSKTQACKILKMINYYKE
jgi:glycosyltransferase involved in cell wall biosynthesis